MGSIKYPGSQDNQKEIDDKISGHLKTKNETVLLGRDTHPSSRSHPSSIFFSDLKWLHVNRLGRARFCLLLVETAVPNCYTIEINRLVIFSGNQDGE